MSPGKEASEGGARGGVAEFGGSFVKEGGVRDGGDERMGLEGARGVRGGGMRQLDNEEDGEGAESRGEERVHVGGERRGGGESDGEGGGLAG